MQLLPQTVLCRYRYDPLDRSTSHTVPGNPERQRFYCKSRLATEIQGALHHLIFQHGDQLLAQQLRQEGEVGTTLLATDTQRSVLQSLSGDQQRQQIVYTLYGYRSAESGLTSLLGFNGERADPVTGHYLLGNGYRAFNPILMRFNSPDSWSPFAKGGLNSYAYCLLDPVNLIDQNGHNPFKAIKTFFGNLIKSKKSAASSTSIHRTPSFNGRSPARRHSSPSLLTASPSDDQLTDWDLIGHHGTSSNYSGSLMAGLDPKFMGKSTNMMLGDGFYFGTRDIAEEFSFRVADPYGPSNSRFGQPKVLGVYTENFDRLKPGEDYLVSRSVSIYRTNPNGKFGIWNYREIVAKEHIYTA
ncbi:RHS repeat-associated core domain-containing protein [Pseudomonas sp. PCH199]|uniref:RHS repeat-associated core domain-containing protein n=1 Tax=unclassified Pseudomonas TaxID=196821 RepID=UPI000BDAA395|nr:MULTISPECIES: RHS repeat-associated core domain-containing protein [unclassified Pseudomonas]MCW8278809.1 RHS repeat-associated core domain-containing protein [Pseudomonas sp. PCH199]PAM80918.1 RHS repeat-associated core domain-containing protein [Pseudomonas sp. ERMR1:02]